MTDVADQLWAQIESEVYITREQFDRALAEWTIETAYHDGRLAFAALTRGPEFHLASFETGMRITPTMIRRHLDPILERHGCVTTRTPKEGADRMHRFNQAFGFQKTGESEFFVNYRLERKCP